MPALPGDGGEQEQFQAGSCVGKEQKTLLYLAAISEPPPQEGHLPTVPLWEPSESSITFFFFLNKNKKPDRICEQFFKK